MHEAAKRHEALRAEASVASPSICVSSANVTQPSAASSLVDLLVVRLVARVLEHLAVPHDAVLVEHEHGALGDAFQADHVLVEHAVVADHLLVEVAAAAES